ncbi:Uncharacterised protein [Raoultella ornithinolytica]|nr:Uncharacterised protein [Raoultella ornithinolytica]
MFSTLFSTPRRLRKAEIPALAMITPVTVAPGLAVA